MKKVISSVLILSLVLTLVASTMPNSLNDSVIMSDTQMMQTVGGDDADCYFATLAMLGGTLGWSIAVWGTLGAATVAAGISLYSTVTAYAYYCGGGGGGNKSIITRTNYHFERVN